ncbi:hypothetical protein CHGG_01746 [Chaetomium globosum CBS 148.51]|uniref:EF-hand domain-containing protein n=1 Tax=Chaetomium globosum (strain ATCC 6205 / CBS 148.51 / DSM 1962 / NBRC 6347 / NRRL 1970) TaxID=306901 RepID=Q2HDF8_CHAGB|nr:uncharacterized protein CHGG_01746 [Chaetomium globosum CBS 148.51]EAQ93511.1 hypothetical protein CHGG_01746 [Chaetomium globosum CBS 148.51]
MAKLSKETGFERPELEALWEQWTFMASTEWREDPDELGLAMDRKTFERYLVPSGGYRHIAPNLLHDRLFAFYDDNDDDLIGFSEFLRGTAYRRRKDKLRRLVTSRQPLSSLFGREGGFSQPDTDRPREGKVINLHTGETHITDGTTRALNEDTPDTADRQSILTNVFTRQAQVTESLFMPVMDHPRAAGERGSGLEYLNGLLNPPTRISELPALLLGETRVGGDFFVVVDGSQEGEGEQEGQGGEEGSHSPGGTGDDSAENHANANRSSDREGSRPDGRDHRRPSYRVTSRATARGKLFDRWRRRQFYLDEEEGMVPPDDWSDDDDVLALLDGLASDSKAAQPPLSTRSRSSSKVRFVEDTDDFDVRSNPSTSSRSIPERWGGMEIPDAERDLGKEIFYQVSQQAFNEILDTLFKVKEDLAVQAAQTKEKRNHYRPVFESINPDEEEGEASSRSASKRRETSQEESLQQLLALTGYSIDNGVAQTETNAEEEAAEDEYETSDYDNDDDDGDSNDNGNDDDNDDDSMPPLTTDESPAEELSCTESVVYRDPTMPQFRLNSEPVSHPRGQPQPANGSNQAAPAAAAEPITNKPTGTTTANGKKKPSSSTPPVQLKRSDLVHWKRLDLAEEEAKARGGWGRLSFEEFERIYKGAEARGARLDYLGTWIDFCIPST